MTPQEAQIIRDVFAKIRQMGPGPSDPEAARAVEAELRANPAAALALVQVLVGLERERDDLARQNADLAAELQDLESRMAPPPAPSGGLFGGARQPAPWGGTPTPQPQPGGPWGAPPAGGPWGGQSAPQGGGFWSSALRTGAGVAGGLFAFEALKGMFGGHGGGLGGGSAMASGLFDQKPSVNETVNIFEGDRGGSAVSSESNALADDWRSRGLFSDASAPAQSDASYDDYDFGGDFGDDV